MKSKKDKKEVVKTQKDSWISPIIIELKMKNTLAEGGGGYDYQSQATASI